MEEPPTSLRNKMPDRIGAIALVSIFCILTYTESGAIPAAVQTIVFAASTFTVLEVEGKGKWMSAIQSFVTRPLRLTFVAILSALSLRHFLDRSGFSIVLSVVFIISFFLALEVIGYRFQKRLLTKSPDSKTSVRQ